MIICVFYQEQFLKLHFLISLGSSQLLYSVLFALFYMLLLPSFITLIYIFELLFVLIPYISTYWFGSYILYFYSFRAIPRNSSTLAWHISTSESKDLGAFFLPSLLSQLTYSLMLVIFNSFFFNFTRYNFCYFI